LFPWYYGAALHQVPEMVQIADIAGPIAVSFVIVIVNVFIVEILLALLGRKSIHKPTVLFSIVFTLFVYLYGVYKINLIEDNINNIKPITVGMVQSNLPLLEAKRPLHKQIPLDLTKKLKEQNIDLVIWPESGSGQSFLTQSYKEQAKQYLTGKLGVPAIVGVTLVEPDNNAGGKNSQYKLYNTALNSDQEGHIIARYDKQYLLVFGEYLPLGNLFPVLYKISPNTSDFQPGSSFVPFKYQNHNIAVNICYENIIPRFVNQQVRELNPELLVNITNDTWFGDTAEPWQHFALAKFRSIEHHKYQVRVTNSGVTAIIDPLGRVAEASKLMQAQALTGEVRFMSGRSIYSYIGDMIWWLLAVIVFGVILYPRLLAKFKN
jgi:apolipoprotein N-acyltransferase